MSIWCRGGFHIVHHLLGQQGMPVGQFIAPIFVRESPALELIITDEPATWGDLHLKETIEMNTTKAKVILLAGLGLLGGLVQSATADDSDQKTIFTFSGPVEIPGQVLPAGTYVFKLADSSSDRNIVQVFSENEKHLYGTFLAIPDARLQPAGKPIITFDETPAGSPEAVRAWFYPGDTYGHQFVYPRPKAVALAKANNIPVPSMPAELAANTTQPAASVKAPQVVAMRQAPLKAQKPNEEEVEIAEVFAAPDQAQLPATLPTTGSSMPLIGLIGLLSLGTALGLRFAAAKAK
jgi:hypothetical protein